MSKVARKALDQSSHAEIGFDLYVIDLPNVDGTGFSDHGNHVSVPQLAVEVFVVWC